MGQREALGADPKAELKCLRDHMHFDQVHKPHSSQEPVSLPERNFFNLPQDNMIQTKTQLSTEQKVMQNIATSLFSILKGPDKRFPPACSGNKN